jgi:hypothetical protein
MIWSKLRTTDINYVLIYSFVVMIMSLPLPNKSVHSIDEIFFLISHVYNLPFNTTNLCVQTNKQNKKFNLRAENEWKKTPLLKANIYIYKGKRIGKGHWPSDSKLVISACARRRRPPMVSITRVRMEDRDEENFWEKKSCGLRA